MTNVSADQAPAFEAGAVGLPWHRRAWLQGAAFLMPNLVFLTLPVFLNRDQLATPRLVVLVVLLAAIGVVFMGTSLAVELSRSGRRIWTGLLAVLIVAMAIAGTDALLVAFFTPFVCGATVMLLRWQEARRVVVVAAILGIGIALLERELFAGVLALTGLMIGFTVGQSLEGARLEAQLKEAQERTAVLAVAAERERIARDLHDILGHSLTTIAVKADLASRLSTRDALASRGEIDEMAAIARQALADVRATASGMRQVRLASELASARSVLMAAGIQAHTPSALPVLDDHDSELMGYVVREAVTNVVRHSGAENAHVRVTDDSIEVTDDGRGVSVGRPRTGLAGLEQRLRQAGWSLTVDGRNGTTVRAVREAA